VQIITHRNEVALLISLHFYGHITPQSPEFFQTARIADIMVDLKYWECSPPITTLCKNDRVFSDPTKQARTSTIDGGTVSAADCASQSPFNNGIPCPVGYSKSYNACPYQLDFDYCIGNISSVYKRILPNSNQNMSCYLASKPVGLWSVTQFYGVTNVSDVASLWRSPRVTEVAAYRQTTKPFLHTAVSRALAPVYLLLL
jgi:hypothetical protein